MAGLFAEEDEDTLYFSRLDIDEDFGSFSDHPIVLDDGAWPTAEHYFQAAKFVDSAYRDRIRQAVDAEAAQKLGKRQWLKKTVADWKKLQTVYMTRAMYTKFRTYPALADKLLATAERKLMENSQYDYFWGCGRDRRGQNQFGHVLMNVRTRIRELPDENVASKT